MVIASLCYLECWSPGRVLHLFGLEFWITHQLSSGKPFIFPSTSPWFQPSSFKDCCAHACLWCRGGLGGCTDLREVDRVTKGCHHSIFNSLQEWADRNLMRQGLMRVWHLEQHPLQHCELESRCADCIVGRGGKNIFSRKERMECQAWYYYYCCLSCLARGRMDKPRLFVLSVQRDKMTGNAEKLQQE